jgi:hypothetical protein
MEDLVIVTCPVCRRSLALADCSGRHVASEAHYPHLAANGIWVCSPPAFAQQGHPTVDPVRAPRSPGGAPLRLVTAVTR